MGRLQNKVAIVTGGASGMGKATVMRFLDEGAMVVVGDLNADNGAELTDHLHRMGHVGNFRFVKTDVSCEADIAQLVTKAEETFGKLDIMFNNAGIGGAIGPLGEIEVDHWDYTFAVLTRGVFLGIKHASKVMRTQATGGSIINTASIAGLGAGNGPTAYSAAKAAVVNLTQSAALELAPDRIRVNCICPGMIFTPLMHRGDEEMAEATMRQVQPWPDRGEGHHIAAAALYLAEDDSAFVTGEAHLVDGGYRTAGAISRTSLVGSQNRYSGVTHGSTGRAPDVRKLD
ncbi:MAG: SDR family oxidoreductase [Pseudomonadota bacterium]